MERPATASASRACMAVQAGADDAAIATGRFGGVAYRAAWPY